MGVGEEEDGGMGRWGDGGNEGSWELGVGGWGRRGWGDGEVGRWGEEGSWELEVGGWREEDEEMTFLSGKFRLSTFFPLSTPLRGS
uniref:Uncharacterized protein n=2 Tax=Desertifilum tharense IPPAS B-1220 TaxID=1781255 RepID=A0ACD5GT67_9CYAN